MSLIRTIRSCFCFSLISLVLATPDSAHADPGLSALGDLFDGLWYLFIFLFGISTTICLIAGYSKRRRSDRKTPLTLLVSLGLYILFASRRFFNPEPNLETLFTIVSTLLFCLGVIYYSGISKISNYKATGLLLFVSLFILVNPRFITYNNHIFIDTPPFESNLRTTALTHPLFAQISLNPSIHTNLGYAEFLQTSDGSIYYGTKGLGLEQEGTIIKREPADSCDDVCQHCSGDCFDFSSIYQNSLLLEKPKSRIDLQKSSNFPNAPYTSIPSFKYPQPLINIPIKDKFINPNSTWHRGTLKLVSQNGTMVWNPLNSWLWNSLCEDNRIPEEIDDLVWENIDPNYAPNEHSLTLFYCAIEKANLDKIKLLATLGGDPNFKVNVGWDEEVNSIFLVTRQRFSLGKKKELFEFLIEIGADINAQSKKGSSVLHTVVKGEPTEDRVGLAKLLLSLGADKNSASYLGKSPIEYARDRRDTFIEAMKELEEETDRTDQQKKWNLDRMRRIISQSSAIIALLED